MNYATLFDISASFGNALALLDLSTGTKVTHGELRRFLTSQVERIDGNGPVATCRRPDFEHAIFLLAMLAQGRLVAPIGFRLPLPEAQRRAAFIGASAFYCDRGFERLDHDVWDTNLCGSALFTSGSSGSPRAVVHDLSAHIVNAQGAASRIPLEPGCGWLLSLPLHHVSGFSVLIRSLLSGATIVIPDVRMPLENHMAHPSVTHLSVVAMQLQRLLQAKAPLQRLHAVLGGGGPFPKPLIHQAVRAGVPLHITYGMTETASQISTSEKLTEKSLEEDATVNTSPHFHAGQVLPYRQVKISMNGEIHVKGPVLALGVIETDEDENSNKRFHIQPIADGEGWFPTRDLGKITSEEHLMVVGRKDRMIISGGENIYPEVIESILAEAPGVERAVVVGIPHATYGQRPVAFIHGDISSDQLREFLSRRIEKVAIPDAFHPWPPQISATEMKWDISQFEKIAVACVATD